MSLVLPDSVLEAVARAAERRQLTVAQFVEKALIAQSSAVLSDTHLQSRAERATGRGWKILDSAPDAAPVPGDELPAR